MPDATDPAAADPAPAAPAEPAPPTGPEAAAEPAAATEPAAAGDGTGTDPSVENLAIVWASIGELCAELPESDWDRPTACPGWTVRDQLSHLVGPEAMFTGRPPPAEIEDPPPYVRNDIGRMNEAAVALRRAWHGEDVLAEFQYVIDERLTQLRAMTEEELTAESWTPMGTGTYRDLLVIRAFDAWVHEQDIREALHRPGHLSGPVAAAALDRCFLAMPYVVGKRAAAAEGSSVRFDVDGPTEGTLGVLVSGGRAKPVDPPPEEPGTMVRSEFLTFTRLGCGRGDAAEALAKGTVGVDGDRQLGERIVHHLSFMI
jgi:uncharacterized protein (TIGR03083 family)